MRGSPTCQNLFLGTPEGSLSWQQQTVTWSLGTGLILCSWICVEQDLWERYPSLLPYSLPLAKWGMKLEKNYTL